MTRTIKGKRIMYNDRDRKKTTTKTQIRTMLGTSTTKMSSK